ncbi:MAG: hypothetical protein ACI9J5_003358, partial [Paraglaciecola sp.]
FECIKFSLVSIPKAIEVAVRRQRNSGPLAYTTK